MKNVLLSDIDNMTTCSCRTPTLPTLILKWQSNSTSGPTSKTRNWAWTTWKLKTMKPCPQVSPFNSAPPRPDAKAVAPRPNFWWTSDAAADTSSQTTPANPRPQWLDKTGIDNLKLTWSRFKADPRLRTRGRSNDNSSRGSCFLPSSSFSWQPGRTCSAPWTMTAGLSAQIPERQTAAVDSFDEPRYPLHYYDNCVSRIVDFVTTMSIGPPFYHFWIEQPAFFIFSQLFRIALKIMSDRSTIYAFD